VICKTLQIRAHISRLPEGPCICRVLFQRTATRCNMMLHAVTRCNTHCDTLQQSATHCNTLQHIATLSLDNYLANHSNQVCNKTLQQAATHCNTLQHTATRCFDRYLANRAARTQLVEFENALIPACCSVLQCVAVSCSVLQCVAVCCRAL